MERFEFQLPGGYTDKDNTVLQQVFLKPLNGFCEKVIGEKKHAPSASLVTSLLSQSICQIGTIEEISEKIVRQLLAGDRMYLLLKLREITFGKEIQAVVNCRWNDCGKPVDIDFSTNDIPVKNCLSSSLFHEMSFSGKNTPDSAVFRLPNGEDQELISPFVDQNENLAEDMLLNRCIISLGSEDQPSMEEIANLSPEVKERIKKEMQLLAPEVSLTMEALCPECQRLFKISFDLQEFILRELRTQSDLLFREVHYLAYNYHWSEKEILGMTRENRRRYIAVLSDEIERLNHAY